MMKLGRRTRRLLHVSLAAILAVGLAWSVFTSVWAFRERQDGIQALEVELDAAAVPDTRRPALGADQGQSPVPDSRRLMAPSAAESSSLIERFAHDIASAPLTVETIRFEPAVRGEVFSAVRASLSLKNVPSRRLGGIISALERQQPPILIDTLRIAAHDAAGSAPASDQDSASDQVDVFLGLRSYHENTPPVQAAKPGSD